jgi:hypothetical protein
VAEAVRAQTAAALLAVPVLSSSESLGGLSMAHFAEIDTNTVLRVLVVHNDYEHQGQEFLADTLGFGGTWIQTSYNTRGGIHYGPDGHTPDGGVALRGNYAGVGYIYDPDLDAFYQPAPFPSWELNTTTYTWEAPTAYPGVPYEAPFYEWDEATTSWVEVE